MAITVGFKRSTVGVFDSEGISTEKIYTIEGKQNKGGTIEASISGISPEAIKVFASDIAYYISQKGVGDLKCELSAIDIPVDVQAAILGWLKDQVTGIIQVGDTTEPPYTSLVLESVTALGDPVAFALYKGRFSLDEINLKTREEGAYEPEAEKITMSCVTNDDGNSVGIAIGEDQVKALKKIAFPNLPSA